jgi:hypothetical protein
LPRVRSVSVRPLGEGEERGFLPRAVLLAVSAG